MKQQSLLNQSTTVQSILDWLHTFGKSSDTGNTRLLYSNDWMNAQNALFDQFQQSSLTPYFDDVGNLFGRVEGINRNHKEAILVGSHIDTVIDGGKYDGVYGIAAAWIAVRELLEQHGRPLQTIEVASLCEEEGSRFPLTFWGSGNITNKHKQIVSTEIVDHEDVSLYSAMIEKGFGLGRYPQPYRGDLSHFLEVHIEQGCVLEQDHQDIGIVQSIVGQRRYTIVVNGKSDHAGTTPMNRRVDAMESAASLMTSFTQIARRLDDDLVSTVGKIEAKPNTPNVICHQVTFSLDVRHPSVTTLELYEQEMNTLIAQLEREKRVNVHVNRWTNVKPVNMDASLVELAYKESERLNYQTKFMHSGAGHDAQIFGTHCKTSLLFVPSKDGISHSPKEFTAEHHLRAGVDVLKSMIYTLAYEKRSSYHDESSLS
ncbi:M20 family metallo-hydrolase [Geomicrobium sediminis]|uniref:Allantoate deiminase n=1 Tax=Geomicrobium sediminis TaxID=1347788 RepID=A0ABS2P8H3_9BACL|nr:M20 family metallo-hydrolase [Geomicrobium sediminis]MBM7631718.1 allantoate deiminase [Geomicrobium sediminis]